MNDEKITNNFFRKDLNLKSKWWHRLLIVLYLGAFILSVIYVTVDNNQVLKYKSLGNLEDRMSTDLKKIRDLVNQGERIGENENRVNDNLYYKNGGFLLDQEIFCATNITDHIDEFANIHKTEHFKGNDALLFASSKVSAEEFKRYLRSEGANCIEIGNVNEYTDRNRVWYGVDKVVQRAIFVDDMNVYEIDKSKNSINRIFNPAYLGIIILYLFILILYYKVILYIVFGNYKKYES